MLPSSSTHQRPPTLVVGPNGDGHLIENTHSRQWLEKVAAACEGILADGDLAGRAETNYAALLEEVAMLLTRVNAELATAAR
jgi:hypothetical protein